MRRELARALKGPRAGDFGAYDNARANTSLVRLAGARARFRAARLSARVIATYMLSAPPWNRPSGLARVIAQWRASNEINPCLALDEELPAAPARTEPLPPELAEPLRRALVARGVGELYCHQAEAFAAARRGEHVVVATPTASGKSLCFHLPVLQSLCEDPNARALYLFPTKALARDQEASLRGLLDEAELPFGVGVYDGDTPADARRATREKAPLLVTNPDMLHAGILPHHARWAQTFRNLRYVVVDELHAYRGVFGSHLANVLTRLRRVARFHGADPVFLCASATIGNAREHAARLIGVAPERVRVVGTSGAPRGPRTVIVYNPPVINAAVGLRASYLRSGVRLAADLVRARVPTLVFAPSRNSVEIVLRYLRDACEGVVAPNAIMGYRGGYLPAARRQVEWGMREGGTRCVVATSALELGIDVGELSAVVCLGYPGSIAGLWQRFGRAGRRQEPSLALMVASSAPTDQYVARDRAFLLGRAPEEARIDPSNLEILLPHLKCAAFELPFVAHERFEPLDAESSGEALAYLAENGVLHATEGGYHWAADAYPANHTNLRSTGWENFVIVDVATSAVLAELDWRAAHTMLHERAIYQHDGVTYEVERLDYEGHKAFVRKIAADYFTEAMVNSRVAVLETGASRPLENAPTRGNDAAGPTLGWGDVSVIEKVIGFKKVTFYTHENAGYGNVSLPDMQSHTTGVWVGIPDALCRSLRLGRAVAVEGLRGVAAALEWVSALALACETRDLHHTIGDGIHGDPAPRGTDARWEDPYRSFEPTIFLYDAYPGGVGLAARIYDRAEELMARAAYLVEGCPCERGCPACVGPGDDNMPGSRKATALRLLAALTTPKPAPAGRPVASLVSPPSEVAALAAPSNVAALAAPSNVAALAAPSNVAALVAGPSENDEAPGVA